MTSTTKNNTSSEKEAMNITFRELTPTHTHYCKHFWRLYTEAFPPEERRTMGQQLQLIHHPEYHVMQILGADNPVGFITYWDFPTCVFLEHFAIAPSVRGNGIGASVLELLLQDLFAGRSILLEVEPPREDIQKRRVRFYQNRGFHLLDYPYKQPPYQPQFSSQSMCLMSYPLPLGKEQLAHFMKHYHPVVYPNK